MKNIEKLLWAVCANCIYIAIVGTIICWKINSTPPVEENHSDYLEHQNNELININHNLDKEKNDSIEKIKHSSDSDALDLWYQLLK